MKKLALLLALLVSSAISYAQYFNNVNSELCYQLYTTGDQLGSYRVYIVIDNETTTLADTAIFSKWKNLSQGQRSSFTQRWAMEGRRIEAERAPYITYPPVFPNMNFFEPQPLPPFKPDWSVWERGKTGKKYWAHPDRPF